MILGVHAPVRFGFLSALEYAAKLGCGAAQVFPYPPGRPLKMPSASEAEEFRQFRAAHSISVLAVHCLYQPNIASVNDKVRARSRESLFAELDLAETLGAEYFVIHSGSFSPGSNASMAIRKSAEVIREALERVKNIRILIENVPGGARRIGGHFEELRDLLQTASGGNRIGICFDTAHAYAAGEAIGTKTGMEECLAKFDKIIGLEFLKLFHLNDAGGAAGLHQDIHARIGKGFIGAEILKSLARDARFRDVAGILETPPPITALTHEMELLELRG